MQTIYHRNTRAAEVQVLDSYKSGSWLHIIEPNEEELAAISRQHRLDFDLLKDALDVYESPRIEQEDENIYIFTRYCYPEGITIATEPLLIIFTPECVITVLRQRTSIFDRFINGASAVTTTQKTKTLLQFLGAINNSYRLHIHKINKQILSIRTQLKKDTLTNSEMVQFIDLEDDLNECLTALQPYGVVLRSLLNGRYIRLYEEDRDLIEDLLLGTTELTDLTRSRLSTMSNIREAYSTIATNNLNRIFKRLTSIGIFLAIPTIISSLYGMNISLPFADRKDAFWIVLSITVTITSMVMAIFYKKKWI